MKKILFQIILISIMSQMTSAQNFRTYDLYNDYPQYKETAIKDKRFKHEDIVPLIKNLEKEGKFKVENAGKSIEGRDIYLLTLGHGDTKVFLWSQMHGDESTATMALFDIFNFFSADDNYNDYRNEILDKVTIYFMPMVNPDGAEVFRRRNALGVDLNRDAVRLTSPESKILKSISDSVKPEFGFNLHDQSEHYGAGRTYRPATISFLAPAYNYEKTVNDVRTKTMQVIVDIKDEISNFIPGHIGRYNDDFEPRAFGDNFVKWGTSSVLIESGGWENDTQKQFIRKINFIAILSGLRSIAEGYYENNDIEEYRSIPENDEVLFDLKLTGLNVNFKEQEFLLDVGINHYELQDKKSDELFFRGVVADLGDLSTYYGYEDIDCSGMTVDSGKVYPEVFDSYEKVKALDFKSLLKDGYIAVRLDDSAYSARYTELPVIILKGKEREFSPGIIGDRDPNFLIRENGEVKYAVINGFIYDLVEEKNGISNGYVY